MNQIDERSEEVLMNLNRLILDDFGGNIDEFDGEIWAK